ncbi:hypothetical protein QBC47DRAFT_216083 [Echria macrotheca]|uniref:Uncharacterized protein n=1 Tax=Echria macrotheca TaxID=438768 RepID=A0AAJ0F8F7_9PEZI|nr:hypothetical protein QBC47DRAFT_216083 [Echria macrotheca]
MFDGEVPGTGRPPEPPARETMAFFACVLKAVAVSHIWGEWGSIHPQVRPVVEVELVRSRDKVDNTGPLNILVFKQMPGVVYLTLFFRTFHHHRPNRCPESLPSCKPWSEKVLIERWNLRFDGFRLPSYFHKRRLVHSVKSLFPAITSLRRAGIYFMSSKVVRNSSRSEYWVRLPQWMATSTRPCKRTRYGRKLWEDHKMRGSLVYT